MTAMPAESQSPHSPRPSIRHEVNDTEPSRMADVLPITQRQQQIVESPANQPSSVVATDSRTSATFTLSGMHLQTKYWLGGHGLLAPVKVLLGYDGPESFTAVNPSTGIFGAGSTPGAAIADLREALADHLHFLEGEEALSESLQDQLEFLQRHIRRT